MHVRKLGSEGKPATEHDIRKFKDKLINGDILDVHVLTVFEVDMSDLNVNTDLVMEATRQTVEGALKKSFCDVDTVKFVLATTNTDPRIEGAEKCTVERVPNGHFVIRGDDKLATDLRVKIGLQNADVYPSS